LSLCICICSIPTKFNQVHSSKSLPWKQQQQKRQDQLQQKQYGTQLHSSKLPPWKQKQQKQQEQQQQQLKQYGAQVHSSKLPPWKQQQQQRQQQQLQQQQKQYGAQVHRSKQPPWKQKQQQQEQQKQSRAPHISPKYHTRFSNHSTAHGKRNTRFAKRATTARGKGPKHSRQAKSWRVKKGNQILKQRPPVRYHSRANVSRRAQPPVKRNTPKFGNLSTAHGKHRGNLLQPKGRSWQKQVPKRPTLPLRYPPLPQIPKRSPAVVKNTAKPTRAKGHKKKLSFLNLKKQVTDKYKNVLNTATASLIHKKVEESVNASLIESSSPAFNWEGVSLVNVEVPILPKETTDVYCGFRKLFSLIFFFLLLNAKVSFLFFLFFLSSSSVFCLKACCCCFRTFF